MKNWRFLPDKEDSGMSRQVGILGVIAGVLVFGSVGWAGPQVVEVSPSFLGFGAY